jgi:probable phosphoglycerate mutase
MSIAIVIRPGETDFDQQSRIQGALGLPLTTTGQHQVEETISRLEGTPLDVVYASPTEPALSTARQLGAALDVPVKELEGLENIDHGLWEGMLLEDVRRKHPRVYKQWREQPEAVCPPEGETCGEAYDRVRRALKRPSRRRHSFAVVAPEPLATIVSSVLRGQEPSLPGPMCGCASERRVEVIDSVVEVSTRSPAMVHGASQS